MYSVYFDVKIHETNRNRPTTNTNVISFIVNNLDLVGVLYTVTVD